MRKKRFLLHDPEVKDKKLVCRRCGVSEDLSGSDPKVLYGALGAMDDKPCSVVRLDRYGMPQGVR